MLLGNNDQGQRLYFNLESRRQKEKKNPYALASHHEATSGNTDKAPCCFIPTEKFLDPARWVTV